MIKYLTAVVVLMTCCSFVSFRFVQKNEQEWDLYIYPLAVDTVNTYIVQHCKLMPRTSVQRIHSDVWEELPQGFLTTEKFFLRGEEVRNLAHYPAVGVEKEQWVSSLYNGGERDSHGVRVQATGMASTLVIEDSITITTTYFANGLLKGCSVSNRPDRGSMLACDSLHNTFTTGTILYGVTPVYDTLYIRNHEDGTETIRMYQSDADELYGNWCTYNREGVLTESLWFK